MIRFVSFRRVFNTRRSAFKNPLKHAFVAEIPNVISSPVKGSESFAPSYPLAKIRHVSLNKVFDGLYRQEGDRDHWNMTTLATRGSPVICLNTEQESFIRVHIGPYTPVIKNRRP